jgi:hypothetical protein
MGRHSCPLRESCNHSCRSLSRQWLYKGWTRPLDCTYRRCHCSLCDSNQNQRPRAAAGTRSQSQKPWLAAGTRSQSQKPRAAAAASSRSQRARVASCGPRPQCVVHARGLVADHYAGDDAADAGGELASCGRRAVGPLGTRPSRSIPPASTPPAAERRMPALCPASVIVVSCNGGSERKDDAAVASQRRRALTDADGGGLKLRGCGCVCEKPLASQCAGPASASQNAGTTVQPTSPNTRGSTPQTRPGQDTSPSAHTQQSHPPRLQRACAENALAGSYYPRAVPLRSATP